MCGFTGFMGAGGYQNDNPQSKYAMLQFINHSFKMEAEDAPLRVLLRTLR